MLSGISNRSKPVQSPPPSNSEEYKVVKFHVGGREKTLTFSEKQSLLSLLSLSSSASASSPNNKLAPTHKTKETLSQPVTTQKAMVSLK